MRSFDLPKLFMIGTLLMGAFISSEVLANLKTSEISIGSIDRKTGGRTYIIGLSASNIQGISFGSSSDNPNAKVNVLSVDYFYAGDVVSLVSEPQFTKNEQFVAPLSFGLEDLGQYPLGDKTLFCKGFCLQVTAEAYGADDVHLNILVSSYDENVYMTSLSGMPSKVQIIVQDGGDSDDTVDDSDDPADDDFDDTIGDGYGDGVDPDYSDVVTDDDSAQEIPVASETFYKTYRGVLIRVDKVTENLDGSRNYYGPRAFWGDRKYPVTSVDGKFCQAIKKGKDERVYKSRKYYSKLAFLSYDNIYTIAQKRRIEKITCER